MKGIGRRAGRGLQNRTDKILTSISCSKKRRERSIWGVLASCEDATQDKCKDSNEMQAGMQTKNYRRGKIREGKISGKIVQGETQEKRRKQKNTGAKN